MSKKVTFKVGDIVKNEVNQFTKILSIIDNRFGLSGWTTLPNAKKATVVTTFLNIFGMEALELEVVSKDTSKESAPTETKDDANAPTNDKDVVEKPTKSALTKLSADEVDALAESLGISTEGTKPEVLERLFAHYEL